MIVDFFSFICLVNFTKDLVARKWTKTLIKMRCSKIWNKLEDLKISFFKFFSFVKSLWVLKSNQNFNTWFDFEIKRCQINNVFHYFCVLQIKGICLDPDRISQSQSVSEWLYREIIMVLFSRHFDGYFYNLVENSRLRKLGSDSLTCDSNFVEKIASGEEWERQESQIRWFWIANDVALTDVCFGLRIFRFGLFLLFLLRLILLV